MQNFLEMNQFSYELISILRKEESLKEIFFIKYCIAKDNLEDTISFFIIFATENKNESFTKA